MTYRPVNIAPILEAARRAAAQAVVRGTESVRTEAVRLILDTPKTGRAYSRGEVTHIASAPGEPPASDTGRLVGSIRAEYSDGGLSGRVVAGSAHAPYLEFGTAKMAPRPFMRPALARRRAAIEADITRSVARAVRVMR